MSINKLWNKNPTIYSLNASPKKKSPSTNQKKSLFQLIHRPKVHKISRSTNQIDTETKNPKRIDTNSQRKQANHKINSPRKRKATMEDEQTHTL